MSGGALDYAHCTVNNIAHQTLALAKTPLHRAFASHLFKVATALHDLELALSGDIGEGSEDAVIRSVVSRTEEIESATADAERALSDLQTVLSNVR